MNVRICSPNGLHTAHHPLLSCCHHPPLGTVSFGSLPVCHRLTTSVWRALLPRDHHYNIHVPSSFFFYNHSLWFSGLPFKWSSGNMNFLTYAFHNNLTP